MCVCVCLSTYIVCIYSILLHNECTSMYSMCLSLTHSLLFRWTPPSISLKSSGSWWVSALSSTWGQINRWHLRGCECVYVQDWQDRGLSDIGLLSADRSQLLPLLPALKGRLYSQILIYALACSNFYLGAPCWTPVSSGSLFMNLLKDRFGIIHWLVTFYWKCNELTCSHICLVL